MKVVAINGSPRKGGNTEIMLNAVLEPLKSAGVETKLIQIGGKNIQVTGFTNIKNEQLTLLLI